MIIIYFKLTTKSKYFNENLFNDLKKTAHTKLHQEF